jgi:2-phosphosulfolactate phosphatase
MKFSRRFSNHLQNTPDSADTVVVVDVLRSFTTAAVAFARGARCIYPVSGNTPPAAWPDVGTVVTVGSLPGGDPAPGFDYGNSPAALTEVDLAGKAVVLSTAAGVAGLLRFRQAPRLYAASLAGARATAAAIRAAGAREVCFVITGEWIDRDGDEDIACADYLEALLRGLPVVAADYERRVRESDFGRRFTAGGHSQLPAADLELCAQADRFDFAMSVRQDGDRLVIVAEAA